jgi:glycosyltransferase 2 family protein
MMFFRRHLATIFGFSLSAIAISWLAWQFNLSELSKALSQVDLQELSFVPALIAVSFLVRAQRWRLLVEHQPPIRFRSSFSALMLGYLLNNLLPARAGDVARALELGRSEQMSRTKVFATLVTERTIDLVVTLSLLGLVLMSYPALPDWIQKAGIAVALVAGSAGLLLVLAHTTGRRWIPMLIGFVTRFLPSAVERKLDAMAISALDGIAGVFRPLHALGFLVLTGFVWVVEVMIVYIVAHALALPLALGNALLVLLILAIGSMVPSSPGQVGTYEFVGLTALALLGMQGSQALAFVVLLHVVTLAGSTIIGVLCLLFRQRGALLLNNAPSK